MESLVYILGFVFFIVWQEQQIAALVDKSVNDNDCLGSLIVIL